MSRANDQLPPVAPFRILLVEDDADLRLALADYLRLRGLDVTESASGIGYYQALRNAVFDVAIIDVNLPDISGFDLARELSSERRCGVILLTARTARQDRIDGYQSGADLYLTKPVDSEELFLAVQNLGRRVSGTGGNEDDVARPAEALSWWLDLTSRLLIAPSGKSIALTGREIMLMQYLAEAQQGATVTRSTLVGLLGYENLGPESRSLDAVLRRLRHKAHAAQIALPLHSIHSLGIRFTAPISVT